MDLLVICADCSAEYKASGDDGVWTCTACGHKAENRKYPFLTRRVAHAKSHRADTNWEEMFDEVISAAHEKVVSLEARVGKLEEENKRLRARESKGP